MLAGIVAVALLFVVPSVASGDTPELEMRSLADRVYLRLQEARSARGLPEWTRIPELDELAAEAAERAGRNPWSDVGEYIHTELRSSGVVRFHRIVPLVQTLKGYHDKVQAAVDQWRAYSGSWDSILDPSLGAIGIADTVGADGSSVVVAILIEYLVPPDDLQALEREIEEAVNHERAERGLKPLRPNDALADVAREHSRDMAARGYFSHASPEGYEARERALVAGITFVTVAENLLRSLGAEDPAQDAVRQWMRSRGHRKNILDPEHTETGVGIEIDDDGRLYFTQLFVKPLGKDRDTDRE